MDMMKQLPPPRIAAVHDLSCVGRCACTVILPTLSVMGYQTVPIPTALLSSHTGGFDDLYFRDLTDDMHEILAHFDRLNLSFRAIYTGFLGSDGQIRTVKRLIERFGHCPDESGQMPLILIDPVMGDDGVLYSTYTPQLVDGIRELSRYADVLTPNLTEACLLTRMPYRDTSALEPEAARTFVQTLIHGLRRICNGTIVVTGIVFSDGTIANAATNGEDVCWIVRRRSGTSYPGTGDIFASVLLGRLLAGWTTEEAVASAADFTGDLIEASSAIETPTRMGVALEPHLKQLIL